MLTQLLHTPTHKRHSPPRNRLSIALTIAGASTSVDMREFYHDPALAAC